MTDNTITASDEFLSTEEAKAYLDVPSYNELLNHGEDSAPALIVHNGIVGVWKSAIDEWLGDCPTPEEHWAALAAADGITISELFENLQRQFREMNRARSTL